MCVDVSRDQHRAGPARLGPQADAGRAVVRRRPGVAGLGCVVVGWTYFRKNSQRHAKCPTVNENNICNIQ